jgi:hypothetical protein
MLKKLPAILMRLWLAYLTVRYMWWGPKTEGLLLCSFAFLEGARMIASALVKSHERASATVGHQSSSAARAA